jgi:hypothetical protein
LGDAFDLLAYEHLIAHGGKSPCGDLRSILGQIAESAKELALVGSRNFFGNALDEDLHGLTFDLPCGLVVTHLEPAGHPTTHADEQEKKPGHDQGDGTCFKMRDEDSRAPGAEADETEHDEGRAVPHVDLEGQWARSWLGFICHWIKVPKWPRDYGMPLMITCTPA